MTVCVATLSIAAVVTGPVEAIKVLAFGDSMTAGTGDQTGDGYPRRLRKKLGGDSTVGNHGIPGEVTSEGLSRLGSVLGLGGDVVLLMEGTNDITRIAEGSLSVETTLANISAMVARSRAVGIEPVLSSIVPRPPDARRDKNNSLTAFYAGGLRELAFQRELRFADAFDLFDPELVPDGFAEYYAADPDDRVGHLNEAGYDKLAGAFADVLTFTDTAPPVIGNFEPGPLPNEVPAGIKIRIPVYDFKGSSGLNLAETKLLINGKVVADGLESEGNEEGVELSHRGDKALGCRAVLRVRAEDTAAPPNALDRTIAIYGVTGRKLLPGDVDFDCRVDGVDLVSFARRFGADRSDPRYLLPFDLNRDGVISDEDLAMLATHFGKSTI